MSVDFLFQLCAQHGIKLTLSGDGSDRLLVDAPKGSLTPSLREALTAHKPELIAALKAQAESETVTEIQPDRPAKTVPSSQTGFDIANTPALRALSAPGDIANTEQPLASRPTQSERVEVEVKNLLEGRSYDANVIEASDAPTRYSISCALLSALTNRNTEQHKRARQAFLDHGYFEDATQELRTADSPAERAAA